LSSKVGQQIQLPRKLVLQVPNPMARAH